MKRDQEDGLALLINLIGNFPTTELQAQNMRPIKQEQFNQLKQSDQI